MCLDGKAIHTATVKVLCGFPDSLSHGRATPSMAVCMPLCDIKKNFWLWFSVYCLGWFLCRLFVKCWIHQIFFRQLLLWIGQNFPFCTIFIAYHIVLILYQTINVSIQSHTVSTYCVPWHINILLLVLMADNQIIKLVVNLNGI